MLYGRHDISPEWSQREKYSICEDMEWDVKLYRCQISDYAGTYLSLTTFSPRSSAAAKRRGGLAPAKYGLPPPSTYGHK